jgi:hypothetical protein
MNSFGLKRTQILILLLGFSGLSGCSPSNQPQKKTPTNGEQAVLIHFDPAHAPGGKLSPEALTDLEDKLADVIERRGLGEFDGHEFALDGAGATFYMYGPDAEKLFAGIEAILRKDPRCRNARVQIRRGSPGTPAREIFM